MLRMDPGRKIRNLSINRNRRSRIIAGMIAAMDLADMGHQVEMFELRPFVGGRVSSWKDKDNNHIEMRLHVFFGCYYNFLGIMKRTGSFD